MKTIAIKEIMNEPVITITPETSVKEAARQMIAKKIGCLPVMEGQSLVGLVTETDILRYVGSIVVEQLVQTIQFLVKGAHSG